MIRAVFWDFGGVILTSPFDAFNEYELAKGLPVDFIRSVNTRDPFGPDLCSAGTPTSGDNRLAPRHFRNQPTGISPSPLTELPAVPK